MPKRRKEEGSGTLASCFGVPDHLLADHLRNHAHFGHQRPPAPGRMRAGRFTLIVIPDSFVLRGRFDRDDGRWESSQGRDGSMASSME